MPPPGQIHAGVEYRLVTVRSPREDKIIAVYAIW